MAIFTSLIKQRLILCKVGRDHVCNRPRYNDTIYNAALSMCADESLNPVRSFKVYVQNGMM